MASDLQEPQRSNWGVSVRLFLTSLLNAKKKKSIEFYDTAAAIFLSSNRDAKEEGREESQERSVLRRACDGHWLSPVGWFVDTEVLGRQSVFPKDTDHLTNLQLFPGFLARKHMQLNNLGVRGTKPPRH